MVQLPLLLQPCQIISQSSRVPAQKDIQQLEYSLHMILLFGRGCQEDFQAFLTSRHRGVAYSQVDHVTAQPFGFTR